MKTIWKVMSVLAIANLLALVGFGGWLKASDRLSMDRVRTIREVFTETLSDQIAREEQEEKDRAEEQRLADLAAKEAAGGEPIRAETRLVMLDELEQEGSARLARMQREMDVLKRMLAEQQQRLDADIATLERDRAAFDAERDRIRQVEGDDQFKIAVGAFSEVKSDMAKSMLAQIMTGTTIDGSDGKAQVVSYLNAMDSDVRSKIIEEFADDDPALAADLLERLRTYGLLAQATEDSGE
jgi:hypothetical protein